MTAATRQRLRDRRQSETRTLRHDGHQFTVTVGFDAGGQPLEVFACAAKAGTALAHLLADAAVIVSIALQHGVEPAALAKSLGRLPDFDKGKGAERPASVLGLILEAVGEAKAPWPATAERREGDG